MAVYTLPLWRGRGAGFYIGAGRHRPGRVVGSSLLQNDGSIAALRAAESANWDFSGSVVGLTGGLNWGESESALDLIDVNGDRYPDLLARDGVRYGKGDGTFQASKVSLDLGTLRHTDTKNVRLGKSLEIRFSSDDFSSLVNYTSTDSSSNTVFSTQFEESKDFGTATCTMDLIDINGDGLLDQIRNGDTGTAFGVRLNLGGSFSGWISWPNTSWLGSYQYPIPDSRGLSPPNSNVVRFDDVGAESVGLGASVGNGTYGVGGGGGWVHNVGRTTAMMVDLNGDGLPDHLMMEPNAGGTNTLVRVKPNLGTAFGPEKLWNLPAWSVPSLGRSHFLDVDDVLAFHRAKSWNGSFRASGCYFIFCASISAFYVDGHGWSYAQMEDIDGDGLPDHVLKLDGDPNVYYKRNKLGGTNLLSKVSRPLGGTIELACQAYGNHVGAPDPVTGQPTIDMPRTQWALSQIAVYDQPAIGGKTPNEYLSEISYAAGVRKTTNKIELLGSGYYDRKERENYGYSHVVTTRGKLFIETAPIWKFGDGSVLEQFYSNQDYYHKGQLVAEYEITADDNVMLGTKIKYKAYTPPDRWFFPAEVERKTIFYEGRVTDINDPELNHKYHSESRIYDNAGNLVDLYDDGDEQGDNSASHTGPDNVHYHMTYLAEPATNITRPISILATDSLNRILRSRTATYVAGKGSLATLTDLIYGGRNPATLSAYNGSASTHTYTYDAYGNVATVKDPNSYQLTYTYDGLAKTYRTAVQDMTFLYKSSSEPNYRFGTNNTVTDINGQVETYTYDDYGRLTEIRGPNDQPLLPGAPKPSPTIAMEYTPGAYPPWARTKHKDMQRPSDTIDTVTFIDGLGRVIQTKKDLDKDETGTAAAVSGMTVSGLVAFDGRGRVSSQSQPVFVSVSNTDFVGVAEKNPTKYYYDSLGRTLEVIGPDLARTSTTYTTTKAAEALPAGLAVSGTWLVTRVTDANGNATGAPSGSGQKVTYRDAVGRNVAVKEYNQIGTVPVTLTPLITQYLYNPMGELTKVIDAKLKETTSTYDSTGHMVTLVSPDAGRTEYLYDLNGNLGAKQTAVLTSQNKYIKYAYETNSNRLKTIQYPSMPNVTYDYGASYEKGDLLGNLAGRVKKVTMEGGTESRTYDKMGNVKQTITSLKHLQQPSLANQVFTMQFTYDSFGRMLNMTYPNWVNDDYTNMAGSGEVVSYYYDHGGNLDRIDGLTMTKNPKYPSQPLAFSYLKHIGYDEFEQRRVLRSGNDILTKYGYDPLTRRLATINAASLGQQERQQGRVATPFHKITYAYDLVGNITWAENGASAYSWQTGCVRTGPMRTQYKYDNLYQLKNIWGQYRFDKWCGYDYTSSFRYDEVGNLVQKSQLEQGRSWDNQDPPAGSNGLLGGRIDHTVSNFSYTLDYTYAGVHPHAAS